MELPRFMLEERDSAIARAKASLSLLDAAFYILMWNSKHILYLTKGASPGRIDPGEIWGKFNGPGYVAAYRRAEKMLSAANDVAAAAFNYRSVTKSYEEALEHFKQDNPGFSDNAYGSAIGNGMKNMR